MTNRPNHILIRRARRAAAQIRSRAQRELTRRRNARRLSVPPARLGELRGADRPVDLATAEQTLRGLVRDNLIPFWYPAIIDDDLGGYRLNLDMEGTYLGTTNRSLIAHTRTIWFFSRLARSEFGTTEHLHAAEHGFRFIEEQMWDREYGGYFWEVDLDGHPASTDRRIVQAGTLAHKTTVGQAFALYAVSEYALASSDPSATRRANELFDIFEGPMRDERYGGFQEFFGRDWAAPAPGALSHHDQNDPQHKTFGTQAHVLEALTPYHRLAVDARAADRLDEMVSLLTKRMILRPICVGSDLNQRDWTPLLGHGERLHNYGHDLERLWLIIDARRALGSPLKRLHDDFRTMFANAAVLGEDPVQGGFYFRGPIGGPASALQKLYWVQAEALLCCAHFHVLTGEEVFGAIFERTLGWITNHQVDWVNGDWHTVVRRDGTPSGAKADAWRSLYHHGRALLDCVELLAGSEPPAE